MGIADLFIPILERSYGKFVQDIETHHVLEEYKGSSFFWLSSLTWGKSNPTQYFLLGCLFLDVDTSL